VYQEWSDSNEMTSEEHKQLVQETFSRINTANASEIDCSGLDLTADELEELVDILKNKTVTSIDLSSNKLDITGMASLQKIIVDHPQITEIDLDGNRIDDNAIIKLLDNEKVCNALFKIDIKLAMNRFGDIGLREGAKFMSPTTIVMMTSSPMIEDQELANAYCRVIGNYLTQESKKPSSLPFHLFLFKQLESEKHFKDEVKDPSQANRLQNADTRIISPSPKKS
jgi:hypothetical protein